ncbi:FAD-dependent monooxygenase [Micromonospora sp. NPDC049559]|uniref:FAD-dependent monooxygenase n=1 Tax=Micromonospora sp. NPDC049559 TaxID=3155923 RepID=UPI003432DF89
MTTEVDADVLIAGYGPVGAVLAALLGQRGVATVVVDPDSAPYPLPRAAALDEEVLRTLVGLPGAADLDRWAVAVRHSRFLGPDRTALFTVSPAEPDSGLPLLAMIDQPELEAALREGVAGLPSVTVRTGRAVAALEPAADAVGVVLDDGTTVRARWVVACDGASSTVRRLAGLPFPGRTFAQPWLVVDAATVDAGPRAGTVDAVTAHGGVPAPAGPSGEATVSMVLDPRRPAVTFAGPGRRRWEWMLLPGAEPAAMTGAEVVRRLVAEWVDPELVRVRRAAVFTFHARQAARWRSGRVLLAGDAAHAMPPFVGQGLATGVRDAASLAWRLVEVVRGGAGGHLLDGYERERRHDIARTTRLSLAVGRVLQTRNRGVSALFRTVLRTAAAVPGLQSRAGRQERARRQLPRRLAGALPAAGRPLPNPLVGTADGPVRLDRLLDHRWAVIGVGCDPLAGADPAALAWLAARDAVVLVAGVSGPVTEGCRRVELPTGALGRGLLGRRSGAAAGPVVVLVRPDRYLLGAVPPPLRGAPPLPA